MSPQQGSIAEEDLIIDDVRHLPVRFRKGKIIFESFERMMTLFPNLSNVRIGALIFFGSFVFILAAMSHDINVYDESFILVGATRVAAGAVPHRDFYTIYGPAEYYALAGLFKVFGPSILVERLWDCTIRAALVAIAFFVVERAASRREAWIASALVLLWLSVVQSYAYPIFPSALFSLLAVLCVSPVFEGRRSWLHSFASGISLGIVVLFRYDVGFYAFTAVSSVLTIYALSRPLSVKERILKLAQVLSPCWLGLAIVCVPVAIVYMANGVLHDFIFDAFEFPLNYYRRMRSLPFPGVLDALKKPTQTGIYLPIAMWVAALTIVVSAGPSKWGLDGSSSRHWTTVLIGALSALFYLKGIVRVSLIHMELSIIPALMLAATLLPYSGLRARGRWARTLLHLIGLIFVLYPTLMAIKNDGGAIARNLAWIMRRGTWTAVAENAAESPASCRPWPGLERVACFYINQARADAVRYIEANSQPDDPLFVGLKRHDRVLMNDLLFYFAAGRQPATKWYEFNPGLQTTKPIQEEMVGELQAAKPRYVVLESDWDEFSEPNESVVRSGVLLLDDFIASNYRFVRAFGSISVLMNREEQSTGNASARNMASAAKLGRVSPCVSCGEPSPPAPALLQAEGK